MSAKIELRLALFKDPPTLYGKRLLMEVGIALLKGYKILSRKLFEDFSGF